MSLNLIRKEIRMCKPMSVILLSACLLAAPSAWSSTASATNTIGQSPVPCQDVAAAVAANVSAIESMAQNTIQQSVPQPANLSSSTCFSNILNMGQSIGLSFFNPSSLLQQLEQMVCNEAQQALQWPMQQVQGAVGQIDSSTGGLAQVTVGANGGSVSSSSVGISGTAPGPAIGAPSLNTGNALSNILG